MKVKVIVSYIDKNTLEFWFYHPLKIEGSKNPAELAFPLAI